MLLLHLLNLIPYNVNLSQPVTLNIISRFAFFKGVAAMQCLASFPEFGAQLDYNGHNPQPTCGPADCEMIRTIAQLI